MYLWTCGRFQKCLYVLLQSECRTTQKHSFCSGWMFLAGHRYRYVSRIHDLKINYGLKSYIQGAVLGSPLVSGVVWRWFLRVVEMLFSGSDGGCSVLFRCFVPFANG